MHPRPHHVDMPRRRPSLENLPFRHHTARRRHTLLPTSFRQLVREEAALHRRACIQVMHLLRRLLCGLAIHPLCTKRVLFAAMQRWAAATAQLTLWLCAASMAQTWHMHCGLRSLSRCHALPCGTYRPGHGSPDLANRLVYKMRQFAYVGWDYWTAQLENKCA